MTGLALDRVACARSGFSTTADPIDQCGDGMRTPHAPSSVDAVLSDYVVSGRSVGEARRPWIVGPAAVDAALDCNAVTLRCGPHTLHFEKRPMALRDVELRLSHDEDCTCEGGRGVPRRHAGETRSIERLVPAVTRILDDATRAGIEKARLHAVGRALFAHVARRLAGLEDRPRDGQALRLGAPTSAYSRRAEVHRRGRVCERSGCGTVLSIYNPSCFCALHLGVVATSGGGRP